MSVAIPEAAIPPARGRTRTVFAALAAVAVVGAFVFASAFLFREPTVRTADSAPAAAPHPAATRAGVLGSVGCSATGCHGGSLAAGRSASAATVWFANDPHVRAFDVLHGELAERIVRRLAVNGKTTPAHQDSRCLACHSNPATVLDANGELDRSPLALAVRREGVGCESCHGPAARWTVPHTTWFHTPEQRPGAYVAHGMEWLNGLTVRAKVCAGCHVGAPEDKQNRIPRRDVTHDMIAAGHPRLAFEFASYTKALPQHWTEIHRAEKKPTERGSDRAAREWLVGQLVCGESLFRLIAAPESNWPEFARNDCYACHYNLDPEDRPARTGPLGRPTLDRWNVSHPLRQLAAKEPELKWVGTAFETGWGTAVDVKGAAGAAAEQLVKWSEQAKTDGELDARAWAAFAALRGADPDRLTWDDAAQCALAIEARWQSAGTAAGPPPKELDDVRAALRFTAGLNGPPGFGRERRGAVAKNLNVLFIALDRKPPR